MIIVIEGADGSGKTHLAFELARKLPAVYLHNYYRPAGNFDAVNHQAMLESINGRIGAVISDRHPVISEPIYGPILRSGCTIDVKTRRTCWRRMRVVYVRPPDYIARRLPDAQQAPGVTENHQSIVSAYDRFFNIHAQEFAECLTYDRTQQSVEALLTYLKSGSLS